MLTFGQIPWKDIDEEHDDYVVFFDGVPVNEGHRLFVPKRNYPELIAKCFEQAYRLGEKLVTENKCDEFNVGINYGPVAGQTVMWPHVHLIPRMKGDTEDPTGGVRNVVPERGNYKTSPYYDRPEFDHITKRKRQGVVKDEHEAKSNN